LSTNRLTQKELRAPDAFQRVGGEARRWLEVHRTLALAAALLLVAAAVAAALTSSLSTRSAERAARALGGALKPLDRPVGEGSSGEEAKPFATETERDQALSAAIDSFRSQYGGTLSASTATLPLGDAQLRLGQPDGALGHFSEFLARAPSKQVLRASALEGEGFAWEAKGQLDRALDAFERLSREETGGFLAGMGLYHRARILALQGKKAEAAQAYQELVTAQPATAAARMAQDRLSLLAAEGILPPPPAAARPDAG